jgi:hypothetical protein
MGRAVIAFSLFVAFMLLLWAATMWGLYIEFRAQRYRDRAHTEADRGPYADHDYMAFWRNGATGQPAVGLGYVERKHAHSQALTERPVAR